MIGGGWRRISAWARSNSAASGARSALRCRGSTWRRRRGRGAFVDAEIVVGADVIDPALARRLGLVEGQAGIIRVRGNSMEPGLVDGDMIVVDLAKRTPGARGDIYVIRADGVTMVKRVRRVDGALVATSDNPQAAAVTGRVEPVGRVVWLMRAPR